MLIYKKVKFLIADAIRLNKDYQRKKSLEGLIRSWLIDRDEVNNSLATDQDKRNARRTNAVMTEFLESRNSIRFRRIAKTLDWSSPHCSLIVEMAMLGMIGNRIYRHALPIALHLDTVLRLTKESELLIKLKDGKRSSDLDTALRMLKDQWIKSKMESSS